MINVTVDGHGRFQIQPEQVAELLAWLASKQGVRVNEQNTVREVKDNKFTGRDLLEG